LQRCREASFPLPDRCPIGCIAVWGNILDLQCDDIAGAELVIDGKIEHREIAGSSVGLKLAPYRPDVPWPKGLAWRLHLTVIASLMSSATGEPALVVRSVV
jgi:hypothetical protein